MAKSKRTAQRSPDAGARKRGNDVILKFSTSTDYAQKVRTLADANRLSKSDFLRAIVEPHIDKMLRPGAAPDVAPAAAA